MAGLKILLALASAGILPLTYAKQVHFDLNLTWQKGAPDGNAREMIFMNDQFPGPELRIDQGDDVEFVVHNKLPFNTSIHFHGIEQHNTPWSDGVPGLTQRPIQPGHSWVYRWTATQYGTYWYHAHAHSEMMDGLYGPIWINPSPETPTPFHLISKDRADIAAMKKAEKSPQLVMLSDWDHLTSKEYQKAQEDSRMNILCMDSVLVNGRGAVYCPGTADVELPYLKTALDNQPLTDKGCFPNIYETQGNFPPYHPERIPPGLNSGCTPTDGLHEIIEVDADNGWVSFKFISAAALKALMFSIDEHPMYIYEVDGSYIEPQLVETVSIFSGERYAAMVKLDKPYKDYTIRVPDTQGDQIISGFATMRYLGSDNIYPSKPYINYGGQNTTASVKALDPKAMKPYPPVTIPQHADQLVNLTLGRWGSSYTWTSSGNALYDMMANWDDPILYDLSAKDNLAPQVTIQTKNGTWVDLLLQLGEMPNTPAIEAPHVMHKHSNKAFILGVGPGFFNWSSTEEAYAEHPEFFQMENPLRRDTFVTYGPTGPIWMILRYQVVNPGPFLFHCHIQTHIANGMAVALLDGIDAWPKVPPGADQSPGAAPIQAKGHTQGQSSSQPAGYLPWSQTSTPKPTTTKSWPRSTPTAILTSTTRLILSSTPVSIPSSAPVPTTTPLVEPFRKWQAPQRKPGLYQAHVTDVIATEADGEALRPTFRGAPSRAGQYQSRRW